MPKGRLPAVGFWSYSRNDDETPHRPLSALKVRVERELSHQLGRSVKIFQDVSAISPGARWEAETRRALEDSCFFIPVITPYFMGSDWCMQEARMFLDRHQRLEALHPELTGSSTIFPIHYIDVAFADGKDEAVGQALGQFQWLDFRELRHDDHGQSHVRKEISRFARSIASLLATPIEIPPAAPPARPPAPSPPPPLRPTQTDARPSAAPDAPPFAEMMAAYRTLIADFTKDGLDGFRALWKPRPVEKDKGELVERETGRLWFVPGGGGDVGVLLPGPEVVRLWQKFYRHLSGAMARDLLDWAFEIRQGSSLAVEQPAMVRVDGARLLLLKRGVLSGI